MSMKFHKHELKFSCLNLYEEQTTSIQNRLFLSLTSQQGFYTLLTGSNQGGWEEPRALGDFPIIYCHCAKVLYPTQKKIPNSWLGTGKRYM